MDPNTIRLDVARRRVGAAFRSILTLANHKKQSVISPAFTDCQPEIKRSLHSLVQGDARVGVRQESHAGGRRSLKLL